MSETSSPRGSDAEPSSPHPPAVQVLEPWTKPWPRPVQRTLKTFYNITKFPDEIIIVIGDNTRIDDLLNFARVSHRFHELLQGCIWRAARYQLFGYPMLLGAARGSIPLMEKSLRNGCQVNKTWQCRNMGARHGFKLGYRPLHLAVINGHADAVDWLLAHGATTTVNHPRRLDKSLSLLLLAGQWREDKIRDCDGAGREDLMPYMRAWKVPEGPRYRIFAALLQAGAMPPSGLEGRYLRRASTVCRVVAAPTLQLMLLHGADPNYLCDCEDHYAKEAEAERYLGAFIWGRPWGCLHGFNFQPWPRPVHEIIDTTRICTDLARMDELGRRVFFPDTNHNEPHAG